MVLVGRAVRDPDGEEGDDGGDEVQAGVGRFGQEAERAGEEADRGFMPVRARAAKTEFAAADVFSLTDRPSSSGGRSGMRGFDLGRFVILS